MKFESKYKTFHSWKCIWIYRLWNGGHFVSVCVCVWGGGGGGVKGQGAGVYSFTERKVEWRTHYPWWRHKARNILVDNYSDDGLESDGTEPLHESMLTRDHLHLSWMICKICCQKLPFTIIFYEFVSAIVQWNNDLTSLLQNNVYRADHSRLAASQLKTSLQSNTVSNWLGANLESALSLFCPCISQLIETRYIYTQCVCVFGSSDLSKCYGTIANDSSINKQMVFICDCLMTRASPILVRIVSGNEPLPQLIFRYVSILNFNGHNFDIIEAWTNSVVHEGKYFQRALNIFVYMRQWSASSLVHLMCCRLRGANLLPEPMLNICLSN